MHGFERILLQSAYGKKLFGTLFPNSYFRNILETLTLKQPPSDLYFVFSKCSFAVVLTNVSVSKATTRDLKTWPLFLHILLCDLA